jgi:hypothetical protein
MKEEIPTDALLREFLLGMVDEEDRARIEDLFLTDPEMRERVLATEQDLIEDYLEDNLSEDDEEKFVSLYAQTEEQRRKLQITASIKNWAAKEARAARTPAAKVSIWNQLWTRLGLKPRFVVPIAVTCVIVIVLAIVWLNSRAVRQEHLAIEQALAKLNSPESRRLVLSETTSLDLRPVAVRSLAAQTELRIPAGSGSIELHLYWTQTDQYSTYKAEVRRLHDGESYIIPNLAPDVNGGYTIRLKLLPKLLSPGQYQVNLTGIAAEGSAAASEEYAFVVVN